MALHVPEELVRSMDLQIQFRQEQLRQLAIYYNRLYPSPKTLVAHGLEETAKLETISAVLEARNIKHITIDCRECLNQRQLLSKIFTAFLQITQHDHDLDKFDRIDSINSLITNLKRLRAGQDEQIVLVLESIDELTGGTHTLLPALARIGDVVSTVSLIFTSSSPRPLLLHKPGVPQIYFPPYSRAEIIQIALRNRPDLIPNGHELLGVNHDQIESIYTQFVTVVYDTLTANTSTSITQLSETSSRLWPRFIWPAISSPAPAKQPWTFAKLLRQNRPLFQTAGEDALQDAMTLSTPEPRSQPHTFSELLQAQQQQHTKSAPAPTLPQQPLLKHFPTLLLLSAYLASHTPQKQDIVLFSRLSSSSTKKRKYLARSRSGGISKTPTKSRSEADPQTTPSKKVRDAEASTPKKERADRSMRAILDRTSNIARPFTLERLIAILRAIHPDGIGARVKGTSDRIYSELAELERLRLVARCGEGEGEERWRCVCSRACVVEWGSFWGVGLEGWEIE